MNADTPLMSTVGEFSGLAPAEVRAITETPAKPFRYEDADYEATNAIQCDETRPLALSALRAAPSEWNFFEPIALEGMAMMLSNIHTYGLTHPITVWEREDQTYMILSGHNRTACFEKLNETYPGQGYDQIPAHIYRRSSLDDHEAQKIIILSNLVQRAKEVTPKFILAMVRLAALLKDEKAYNDGKGSILSQLARLTQKSASSIKLYLHIARNLQPALLDRIPKELGLNEASALADFPAEVQRLVAGEESLFPLRLKAAKLRQLKALADKTDAAAVLDILRDQAAVEAPRYSFRIKDPAERALVRTAFLKALDGLAISEKTKAGIIKALR